MPTNGEGVQRLSSEDQQATTMNLLTSQLTLTKILRKLVAPETDTGHLCNSDVVLDSNYQGYIQK